MKLFVKNKLMTLSGASYVEDEAGNKVFKVKGKWGIFSPTKKKKIIDSENQLRYIVRNKFFHFFASSCFIYNSEKQKIAMLSNSDFDFKNKFVLKGSEDEIVIVGKYFQFPNMELEVQKNGKMIGTITKNFTIVRDSYIVDIADDTEDAFLVALVIAIDNIFDKRAKSARR